MNVELLPWQKEAIDFIMKDERELKVLAVSAGYGSGKSMMAAFASILLSIKNAPEPVYACSISNVQLEKTLYREMLLLLDRIGIKAKTAFSGGKQYVSFKFQKKNCMIRLVGLENPDTLIGASVSAIVLDECARIKNELNDGRKLINILLSRIRSENKHLRFIAVSSPDIQEDEWFKTLCERKLITDCDFKFIKATTYDNIICGGQLAKQFIDANKHDPRVIQAFIYGEFVNYRQGAAYHSFDRERNLADVQFDPKYPITISLDFNIDPAVALFGQYKKGILYIFKEYYLNNSTSIDIAEKFLAEYNHPITLVGDKTGWNRTSAVGFGPWQAIKNTIEQKQRWDVSIATRPGQANPPVIASVDFSNKCLYNSKVIIDKTACPKLLKDLELVGWSTTKNGTLDKSKKELSHLADAFNYLCWHHLHEEKTIGIKAYTE